MLNQQPIEARAKNSGSVLDIHSIFETIQGEGPFSGRRAVFIRLAGCNLACPKCDTDYTTNRMEDKVITVVDHMLHRYSVDWLIVISGGEPFRQDIEMLVRHLTRCGYMVQIETNGVLPLPSIGFPELCSKDTSDINGEEGKCFVVVSPKTNKVHPTIEAVACAYKYVLSFHEVTNDGLPSSVLSNPTVGPVARPPEGVPVYVQPCDEKNEHLNKLHLEQCIESALLHGYIIQIQLHKHIGVE
jgi:organic radical activating enzyme